MLFLSLFMCVSLHISAMRSLSDDTCLYYPRTTLSNKIYGLSKGIAITPFYNNSKGYIASNVSCPSGSYVSITHDDTYVLGHEITYIFNTRYIAAYCQQVDSSNTALKWFVDIEGPYLDKIFDAVDCLGKSLVALRLLPLLHVSLHSSSDAL